MSEQRHQETDDRRPIGVGVIGTGGMGGRHAQNLASCVPGVVVRAVMDADKSRAHEVANACGGARVHDDPLTLIHDPSVDAVVIASPDATHAELAIACVKAAKPTLCEKPLATDKAMAAAVVQAECDGGRPLIQLGFMRVFDPRHQEIKAIIDGGRLGRPILLRAVHDNLIDGHERDITDVITNSAVHDFHSARWLMRDEVDQVFARHVPADESRPSSCRLALVQLMFRAGGLATIEVNADSSHGYQVHADVVGERATALMVQSEAPLVLEALERRRPLPPDWLVRFDEAYRREVLAWIGAMRSRQQPRPSAWDGYVALAIADAALASIRSGRPEAVSTGGRPSLYSD